MINGFLFSTYFLLRDTEIGKKNGLGSVIIPPQLTQRGFLRIQKAAFNNLVRLHEDRPEVDAAFVFFGYSEKTEEISYLDATQVMRLTMWRSANSFLTDSIDELWELNRADYQQLLIDDRGRCIINEIKGVNRKRLEQALRGSDSTKFVMCPIVDTKANRTFGVLVVLWSEPKEKEAVSILDNNMVVSARTYAKKIETNTLLQPNLKIKG